jgi:hypothetical protein
MNIQDVVYSLTFTSYPLPQGVSFRRLKKAGWTGFNRAAPLRKQYRQVQKEQTNA